MKRQVRIWILCWAMLLLLGAALSRRAGSDLSPETAQEQAEIPPFGERDSARTLRVLHDGTVEEMTMSAYLVGVLRAEMPASFETEALKAQAIAARTYTIYKMRNGETAVHPDADACDDINCCKAYRTAEDAAREWGSMALYYEQKLARAVAETDGQVILYGGEPILAVFCSSTNGHTQGAGAVWQKDLPYLVSVESPETAELVPNYTSTVRFSAEEFRGIMQDARPAVDLSGDAAGWVTDVCRNEAGFVTSVKVGGILLRGNELRTILSLRSPTFSVQTSSDALTFTVTGYGHGVGMSQYGANVLARQGLSCEEIVRHYFTGTAVGECAF